MKISNAIPDLILNLKMSPSNSPFDEVELEKKDREIMLEIQPESINSPQSINCPLFPETTQGMSICWKLIGQEIIANRDLRFTASKPICFFLYYFYCVHMKVQ